MDTEQIKQMATDINNVAAESFASGVRHTRRVLLPKIEQLQAKNKELKERIEFAIEYLPMSPNKALGFLEPALLENQK